MNKLLIHFLKEWLAWAEAPEQSTWFNPAYGLCHAAINSAWAWRFPSGYRHALADELRLELYNDFSDMTWPFGQDQYYKDRDCFTQHKNPDRLAWVRQKIEELEKLETFNK